MYVKEASMRKYLTSSCCIVQKSAFLEGLSAFPKKSGWNIKWNLNSFRLSYWNVPYSKESCDAFVFITKVGRSWCDAAWYIVQYYSLILFCQMQTNAWCEFLFAKNTEIARTQRDRNTQSKHKLQSYLFFVIKILWEKVVCFKNILLHCFNSNKDPVSGYPKNLWFLCAASGYFLMCVFLYRTSPN